MPRKRRKPTSKGQTKTRAKRPRLLMPPPPGVTGDPMKAAGDLARKLMSLPEDHEWEYMKKRGLKPEDAPDYQESETEEDS